MLRTILSVIIIYAFWLTYQDASAYFDDESATNGELVQIESKPISETHPQLNLQISLLDEAKKYKQGNELSCEDDDSCKSE